MISNVPETPSASSEVQKLVRRFGTVIKTLVLKNMVRVVYLCNCKHANLSCPQNQPLFLVRFLLRLFVRWQLQPWPYLSTNASRHFHVSSRTTHCSSPASRIPRHRQKSLLYMLIYQRLVTFNDTVVHAHAGIISFQTSSLM